MMSSTSPTSGVTIRELRNEDHVRWLELWDGYLRFYRCELPHAVTEFTWRRLIDPAEPLCGLAAVSDANEIVGIVHYHFHLSTWALVNYCYLEDLFVAADSRRAGAGRALILAVYRAADERGATRVYWSTGNDNHQAKQLYDKLATLTPFVQYRR